MPPARPEAAAPDSLSGRSAPGAQLFAGRERRIGAHARGRPFTRPLLLPASALTDTPQLQAINARLIESERQFIDDQGLPRRSWYRHLLYAPGYYTRYGVKTTPGVREAIEDKRYGEVEREVLRVAAALTRETTLLEGMAELIRSGRSGEKYV